MDEYPESEYVPEKDPELLAALDAALDKWKQGSPDTESLTMRSKFLIVVVAEGQDGEGENVNQVMIVPGGSHEDILGMCAGVDTRMRAEIIADILDREG